MSWYLIAEQDTADAVKVNGRSAIETIHENEISIGPPVASVPTRAQSYSDLRNVVSQNLPATPGPARKSSIGSNKDLNDSLKSALEYDEWQHTLEDELLDASHEDYE